MVNFARGQKVVPAGWLFSADGPEISLVFTTLGCTLLQNTRFSLTNKQHLTNKITSLHYKFTKDPTGDLNPSKDRIMLGLFPSRETGIFTVITIIKRYIFAQMIQQAHLSVSQAWAKVTWYMEVESVMCTYT